MGSQVNASSRTFVWDVASTYGDVVAEFDGGGTLVASYVLGHDRLISQTQSGSTAYFAQDALGSTRALTDSSGAVTETYTYSAYGTLIDGDSSATEYLYTGHRYDSASGLYQMRARWYDPGMGRFLTQDTWQIDRGNPVELNRYGYVAGNPVGLVDPSGHFAESAISISNSVRQTTTSLMPVDWLLIGAFGTVAFILFFLIAQHALRETEWRPPAEIHDFDPFHGQSPEPPGGVPWWVKVGAGATLLIRILTEVLGLRQPNPQPDGERDPQNEQDHQYHLAFGRDGENTALAQNLNATLLPIVTSSGVFTRVKTDVQWWNPAEFHNGIPLSPNYLFPSSFFSAAYLNRERLGHIHFNLDGLLGGESGASNYIDYAVYNGNGYAWDYTGTTKTDDRWIPSWRRVPSSPVDPRASTRDQDGNPTGRPFYVTAWELFHILEDTELCMMTSFYSNASTLPDLSMNAQLCNNPTIMTVSASRGS